MFGRSMFPMNRFDEFKREMDRLMDAFGTGHSFWSGSTLTPVMNVWDAGDAICVEAEVPGISKDDLEILTQGNEITLKGRRTPMTGEKLTYHRRERGYGEFTRTITLPMEVDSEKVDATLKDGVLTLTAPKAETAKPKQISVKAH